VRQLAAVGKFAQDGAGFAGQVFHLGLFVGAEFGEHKVGAVHVWVRFGPDANAYPAVLFAQVLRNRFYPVVTGAAAAHAGADLTKRNVQLIVHYHNIIRVDLVKMHYSLHRFPAQVHERRGLDGDHFAVAHLRHRQVAFEVFFVDPGRKIMIFGKPINCREPHIMPRVIVLRTDVTKPDHQHDFVLPQRIKLNAITALRPSLK